MNIDDVFQRADDVGIRLEIIGGLPVWEAHPNLTHQKAIDHIRESIQPAHNQSASTCECVHYADLHIKFPDGSDKRPDISIFCQEPTETESAVTQVPVAVVEIISRPAFLSAARRPGHSRFRPVFTARSLLRHKWEA
jgi:hypothetical protein